MTEVKSAQTGRMSGRHFAVVLTLILMCFTTACFPLSVAGVYYPSIVSYLGLSTTAELSVYHTFINIAMIITLPFAGKIISKFDARIVLSISSGIIALSFFLMSSFNAVWQWYFAGAMQGIGLAFNMYVAVPTIINRWFAQRIGFFIGLCLAFTGIGGIVFNPIAGAIIATGPEGWRTSYIVFGVICVVATLPFTILALRSKPEDVGLTPFAGFKNVREKVKKVVSEGVGITVGKAMKTPTFYLVAFYGGVTTLAAISLSLLPTYAVSLAEALPATAALAATLISFASAGQVLGKIGLGAISDKSTMLSIAIGVVCGIIGFLLIWKLPGTIPAFLAGGFLFGIFFATASTIPPIITRQSFGNADYSNIWSRISIVVVLFGAVANIIWGLLAFGDFSAFFLSAIGAMILSFLFGAGAIITGRKLQKNYSEAEIDQ